MDGLGVRLKMMISNFQKLIFFMALCCLVSCSRNSIDLPNGYRLHDHGKILLEDSKGASLASDEISQFMVSGLHVYGWINNQSEEFFALNTSSRRFEVFSTWDALNHHTDKLSLPRLNMNKSYTYWDIKTGHKHL